MAPRKAADRASNLALKAEPSRGEPSNRAQPFAIADLGSIAIILGSLNGLDRYDIVGAIGPGVALKLASKFHPVSLFYEGTPAAKVPQRFELLRDGIDAQCLEHDHILPLSRKLVRLLAEEPPSQILVIGDCSSLWSVVSIRNAKLGFARTRITVLTDGSCDLFAEADSQIDKEIRRALHQEVLSCADTVIDLQKGGEGIFSTVAGVVNQPVTLADRDTALWGPEQKKKWAILGGHNASRLNTLLNQMSLDDVGVLGQRNCEAIADRHDLHRFDLIGNWSREATLRYLVFEQRFALLPTDAGLEQLDCRLFGIPFSVDLSEMRRERISPAPLRQFFAMVHATPATQKKYSGSGRRRNKTKTSCLQDDWVISIIHDAQTRPGVLSALQELDYDIVVAGLQDLSERDNDLVVDPVSPQMSTHLFEQLAEANVILVRKHIHELYGFEPRKLAEAVLKGASCIAVPVAAAEVSSARALELRSRCLRKAATLHLGELEPCVIRTDPAELSIGNIFEAFSTIAGVKRVSELVVADQTARTPVLIADSVRLSRGKAIEFTAQFDGHCCVEAWLAPLTPNSNSISLTISILNVPRSADRVIELRAATGMIEAFFKPVCGSGRLSFKIANTVDESVEVELSTVLLHTPATYQSTHGES